MGLFSRRLDRWKHIFLSKLTIHNITAEHKIVFKDDKLPPYTGLVATRMFGCRVGNGLSDRLVLVC